METAYHLPPMTKPPYLLTSSIKKIKNPPTFDFANKTKEPTSFSPSHAVTSVPCSEFQNQLSKFSNRYRTEENCSRVFQNSFAITNTCLITIHFPENRCLPKFPLNSAKSWYFVLNSTRKIETGFKTGLHFILQIQKL